MLGVFANAFALSNYEYTKKTEEPRSEEEEKKARKDRDYDERT